MVSLTTMNTIEVQNIVLPNNAAAVVLRVLLFLSLRLIRLA